MRLVLLALVLVAGCASKAPPPAAAPAPDAGPVGDLVFASPAFEDGGDIPREHSCDGAGDSPPLAVADAPPAAVALALVMIDPDVPTPILPTRTIDHWVLWDAPVTNGTVGFPAGGVPPGTVEGANSNGEGYLPPCPPLGSPAHGYEFTVYALDAPLGLRAGATRADLEAALAGHVLAEATLTGMYTRSPT